MKIKDAKWEMTDNYIGMKPKFQVTCGQCFRNAIIDIYYRFCTDANDVGTHLLNMAYERALTKLVRGDFNMILREVFCSPLPTISDKAFHNDMHYKCAKREGCDQVKVFGVPVDKEYHDELLKRRKGKGRVQPTEEWMKEQELKEQLLGLGYL